MPHPGGRRRLSETAAAGIGAFGGDGVGTRLELVGERLELPRLSAGAVRKRLREQPVGEPRVAREQRPVEIRPDRPSDAGAFEAALAVVSEAREDASERLGTGIEPGAAGVVLEARQRVADTGLELALEQDVADHPALAGHGLERQQADARHVLPVEAAIAAPEQLVAAAHGEERGVALQHSLLQWAGLRREVLRDEQLLAVLAAPDVI